MARLADLTTATPVKGIVPDAAAELVSVKWHGSDVVEVVWKDSAGRVGTEILFRDREPSLQILTAGRPWSFDGDRFEGKFRDGVHTTDASDLLRRMVKERLLTFDGTPLFPERIADTVNYKLSDGEARLYKEVTDYVQEQFNLADRLNSEGRRGTVGFALTSLQRRLASSPEAKRWVSFSTRHTALAYDAA